MLRTIIVVAILVATQTTNLFGQTRSEAMSARNKGAEAMQDYMFDIAVEEFEKAMKIAQQLGDDALDIQTELEEVLPSAYYNLAREHVRSNDANKAIKAFKNAIKTGKQYSNDQVVSNSRDGLGKLYFAVGNNFRKNKQLDKALASYQQATEYNEEYAPGYLGIALVYMEEEKEEEFEKALIKAQTKAEETKDNKTLRIVQQVAIRYYYNNAVKARKATRYDESVSQLVKTLEFHPEYEDAYFLLSLVQNELENYSEAINAAEKGLTLAAQKDEEGKARLYFQLARAFQGKGENQEACAAYKQAELGENYQAQAEYARKHVLKCQ